MPNNLFIRYDRLAKEAEIKRGSKEALEWFADKVRKGRTVSLDKVSEGFKNKRLEVGNMIAYGYAPIGADRLPYYDRTPLVILMDFTKDGWYGINLHYLPPRMRAALLVEITYRKKPMQQIARALESNPMTKPCLKRYIAKQLTQKPVTIPKSEWDIAIQLPFESFVKAANKSVWQKSKSKI